MCDEIYHDFWIKELLQEYKFTGNLEFLRENECADAQAVAKSCEGRGLESDVIVNIHEWLKGEEPGEKDVGATDCAVIIHKIDGKIIGLSCTCIYGHNDEKGAVVWVRMIAVKPEMQGRGIGRNLLMQTLQYGVEHRAKRAFLAVDLENKNAVKLYESVEFVRD